ncbi:hypothetical protein [Mucilaginibacter sp. L3T2-6]|uniref:hypothetical protein n=1 Tax=Mucilaginibacter sp. L3T2-6 TaxID=3062491 RepID=UPI002674B784|nr:hypothetical protein [Mucilaginibacter sp. L3T2-6]MDO3644710.1 hypothetical protein [Mucilaginibacter sp. L3T2-6]MDV6217162.1 hypothetical protein [Mucilaginibacter sp. L3T2-6]
MEKKFVLGDVVVMVADGPKMAVEGYELTEDPDTKVLTESDEYVSVVYFNGTEFKRDVFHQDLLLFIDEVTE